MYNNSNNIFLCLFNKKNGVIPSKLFLLHISICYKNIYAKLSKNLENDENVFALIFNEILLIPLIHNFDNAYSQLVKKISIMLFGNSEYISSMMVDLESNEIICDIGILFQNSYKKSFLSFKNKKHILNEILFHGICLKNDYLKSNDKKIDKIENSKKLELRATYPKPLFIIKFMPILKGIAIVHIFSQYKLSKAQIRNRDNPNFFIYDNYKEVDICPFDLFSQLEGNNLKQIKIIEKFFFEYLLISGNNCKDTNQISNDLLTYKNRDFNLIYINQDIIKIIKDIIMEYYIDEKDLIYKIKRKFIEENEKNLTKIKNTNTNFKTFKSPIIIESTITKTGRETVNNNTNINNEEKNPLEFGYKDFIKEFESDKFFQNKKNKNELIGTSDINIMIPGDFSNVNEYSELHISKDNISLIKRNIVTSVSDNNKDFNIYNNYGIINTETRNLRTENENGGVSNNTNDPFNIDVTGIVNNGEVSKDEWGFKSILIDKNKNKQE